MNREAVESNIARTSVEELTSFSDIQAFYQAMAEAYGKDGVYAEESQVRFLSTQPGENLLFAIRDEGKIIAGMELSFMMRDEKKVAYRWNKFVSVEYRGQGLAQELSHTVEAEARANGCVYLFALVTTSRQEAVRSIELAGYKPAPAKQFADLLDMHPDTTVYIKEL